MKKMLKLKNVATFAIALGAGVTLSYFNVAEAGIIRDMFGEPIRDVVGLITEDLGKTFAIAGVLSAILVAWWQQSMMMGLALAGVVGILYVSLENFA